MFNDHLINFAEKVSIMIAGEEESPETPKEEKKKKPPQN